MLPSFSEERFPTDIAYRSSGGPHYATDIVTMHGGQEQRNSRWSAPLARYNVAHGVKTKAQLDELIAFFRARKGRAVGFRFKDWTDYDAIAQQIGVGDGTTTTYPLIKRYTSGEREEIRHIQKPVTGTIQLYLDGVLQNSGVQVDVTTGMMTFDQAPANGVTITADYHFDVPVRFDTDHLAARLDHAGVYSWADIPLVELRL